MNLILITADEFSQDAKGMVRLEGRRRNHIIDVLGAGPGDRVRVGIVNGEMGSGTVIESDAPSVTLSITPGEIPQRPRVTMILAMVRPQIMKRTLQHLATLGVRHIFLVGARRVEKSYFSQRLFDEDEYKEHLLLGLEQAMDTWLPEVSIHRRFRPFIEDTLPSYITDVPSCHRVVAHPSVGSSRPSQVDDDGPVALAIGPEGGWSDFEVDCFKAQGFTQVSLGRRILKVETAVPYLFGTMGL